ncbi:MAG TPA: LysE family transporter [Alphaproteobacteria bacterium]|nr:LysE family transporter [Alphaproteobacteria bacterium]
MQLLQLLLFVKGLAVGFAIAAPVGPVGILCIQRSLTRSVLYGLASGMGAAAADAIYGAIAAFGVSFVADFLVREQYWFQLGGGALLIALGLHTVFGKWHPPGTRSQPDGRLAQDMVGTFFLTITNPITIFSFTAVFVAVGITTGTETFLGGALLTAGVFAGSALWWTVLCNGVGLMRAAFSDDYLRVIHRASGFVMLAFGAGALIHIFT